MANEIQVSYQASKTVYCLIRNRNSLVWNGSTFVTYATADYTDYVVQLTEQGTASGFYAGSMPSGVTTPGIYSIVAKEQLAGSAAQTDPVVSVGDLQWNGSNTLPLADLASSGQISRGFPIRIARGEMTQNFPVYLVSSADHVTPFTSGVVSGQISRDGGAFGAFQSGNFTEIGLGFYKVNLTSGDLLANTVALQFSAVGISGGNADPRSMSLVMQKTSGQ